MPLFVLLAACIGADPPEVVSRTLPADINRSWGSRCPLAFSPDASLVAVATGPAVTVWEVTGGRLATRFHLPGSDGPADLAFTRDGQTVVCVGGPDPTVRWFDVRTGKQVRERDGPGAGRTPGRYVPRAAAVGPGAEWLLVPDSDDRGPVIRVEDVDTGRPRGELRPPPFGIGGLAGSHTRDGRLVVPGVEAQAAVQVWDVAAGKLLRGFPDLGVGRRGGHRLKGVSADGRWAAVDGVPLAQGPGRPTDRLTVCSLDDGRHVATLALPAAPNAVAFSADGRVLAADTASNKLCLYDLQTGRQMAALTLSGKGRAWPASPDGKALAVVTAGYEHEGGVTTLHLTTFPTPADTQPPAGDLVGDQLAAWWGALGSANEFRRRSAVAAFAARPEQATVLVADRVRPEPATRRAMVADLLTVLGDDRWETREKASAELLPLAHRFEPLLADALTTAAPGEVRNRLRTLTTPPRPAPPADLLTDLSGVEVMERVGTDHAKAVLADLAAGADGSRLTAAAKAALGRLGKPAPDVKK